MENSRSLRAAVASYQAPVLGRSLWQIANTFVPFFAICMAMYATLSLSYWLTLGLSVLAAGFVVRIFIIQHDCGHGSFFRSGRANDVLGTVCSLITFAPYAHWRRQHANHHAHWNNLDHRNTGGDVYSGCVTLREYRGRSLFKRLGYRTLSHPAMALLLLPPLIFLLVYRVPFDTPSSWRYERMSLYLTDAALLGEVLLLGYALGFANVLAVQLPIMVVASTVGVYLFSLQHRFAGAEWKKQDEWNVVNASLRGASYLKLPAVLRWFSGNIGFHHVHHLNPRVPNYRLQACHEALPGLHVAHTISWRAGLGNGRRALWDEEKNELVPFPPVDWTRARSGFRRGLGRAGSLLSFRAAPGSRRDGFPGTRIT